ncbi:phage major capsid protein [Deinococcus sp.]|uniref:phage major capsid protein n=1 Tax=Deinococcus sp. TaxID=47478 RepID=UPI00286E8D5D|nr:phage major capsid protein [Deinococcus sp.]
MPLTPEELAQITGAVQAEVTTARATDAARITALEAELADSRSATQAAQNRPALYGADGQPAIRSVPLTRDERQQHVIQRIGNAARGLAHTKQSGGGIRDAAEFVEKRYGDKATAEAMTRALSEGVPGDGGNLVEVQYAADMIELLYPMAVVRGMGAQVIPMPQGNLTVHRQATGVTGRYDGELASLAKQQPTTDVVQMTAKKLAVIVPASNELLHDTSGRVNTMIVNDIGMGLSLREDLAFLRGDGTANTPTGILNQVLPANIITYTTRAALLSGLRARIRGSNVAMRRMGWVFNSDLEALLYGELSTTGAYVFRDEMDGGKLLGFPYRVSNQIPSNLTAGAPATGTNTTEVYFGDWAEILIGETLALALDTTMEGSYFNGTTSVSAFDTDQTLFRARTRHDIALRHRAALAVGKIDIVTAAAR